MVSQCVNNKRVFSIANVEKDTIINALHFCILYAKYYVYKCKIKSIHFGFEEFKIHLRGKLEYENTLLFKKTLS